jgi:hypothetical protein
VDRALRDRDTDRSLTARLDLAVRVDLRLDRDPGLRPVDLGARAAGPVDMVGLHRAVLGAPAGRVVLRLVDRVVPLDLVLMRRPVLGAPAGRVVPDRERPVVPDRQRPVGLVAPARQVGRAVPLDLADRVVPGLMAPVVPDPVVLVVPVGLSLMGRVSLAGPADRVGLVDLADRVVPDLMAPADLVDLVDPRCRRIGPEVSTIAAVPSLVAPPTRRTASVHPTMVRRLLPRSTGSAGTTGLLPEVLRPTGPGRRLRVAGTDLRLPVAGTDHGTDRRARLLWRRPILGHSITVASTPFQSSTRSSADGASGSSARGFRCTDITSTLATSGPWFARPEVAACRCT